MYQKIIVTIRLPDKGAQWLIQYPTTSEVDSSIMESTLCVEVGGSCLLMAGSLQDRIVICLLFLPHSP